MVCHDDDKRGFVETPRLQILKKAAHRSVGSEDLGIVEVHDRLDLLRSVRREILIRNFAHERRDVARPRAKLFDQIAAQEDRANEPRTDATTRTGSVRDRECNRRSAASTAASKRGTSKNR